jgi:hypothetical protein
MMVPSTHSAPILRIAALFVVHSGECDITVPAENLANYFAGNSEGTGPHYVVDGNNIVGQFGEELAAMACGPNGNPLSTQVEQPGRAAYTRDQWRSNGDQQFTNMGRLFADWADRRGIPKRRATNDDVRYFYQGGTDLARGGYVDHDQITESIGGTTHWDVGDSYPWDLFEAAWQPPHPTPVPPTPEDDMFSDEDRAALAALKADTTKIRDAVTTTASGVVDPKTGKPSGDTADVDSAVLKLLRDLSGQVGALGTRVGALDAKVTALGTRVGK